MGDTFEFKELVLYILRHFYIVVAALILTVALGLVYTLYLQTPLYRSETNLVLISNNNTSNLTTNDVALSNNLVKTYANIIKSRNVLDQIIDHQQLSLSTDDLSEQIKVTTATDTQIITVRVSTDDAQLSQTIAADLAKTFKQEVIEIYGIDNVQIVDPASYPSDAYNVNIPKTVVYSAAIGLILGIAIVFLIFTLDTSIKDTKIIEKEFDLTSLGAVPISNHKGSDLATIKNPKSAFAEAIKSIKTNIAFSTIGKDAKVILVTSPEPSDGKSFVTANLAATFAQDGQKVLIIDADLRKGRQHKIFGLQNHSTEGYSNLILNYRQDRPDDLAYSFSSRPHSTVNPNIQIAIKHTTIPKLSLLPTGPTPPNPVGLLGSENNTALLKQLRQIYDIILIDCPPALGLSDALVMSKNSDCNIVVTTANHTKIDQLQAVKQAFAKVGSELSGVILNRVKFKGNSYYSSYYD